MTAIFTLENLFYSYSKKEKQVFAGLNLNVSRTGLTVIAGDNGSGKTTLCRLLTGLNKGYQGSLRLNGRELSILRQESILNSIIYIKQDVVGSFLGVTPDEDLSIWQNRFHCKDSHEKSTARLQALEKMGIKQIAQKPIWELSYGQRRKVMLSALPLFPEKYWIIDEPSASLDSQGIQNLINLIETKIRTQTGCMVLTHRTGIFNKLCSEKGSALRIRDNGQIEKLL